MYVLVQDKREVKIVYGQMHMDSCLDAKAEFWT